MTTKCPKCGVVVSDVSVKEVRGCALGGRVWPCLSVNCANCDTSLGVHIDPLAIRKALVDEIQAGFR